MPTPLFALLVLAAAAVYFMKPAERARAARAAADWLSRTAIAIRDGRKPHDDLDALVLARTPRVFVAPLIVIVSIVIWLALPAGSGSGDALITWGANYAPRTTNGESWRLIGYAFVHRTFFQVVALVAVMVPLGMTLERLVGAVPFAAVYVAGAVVAGAVSLWVDPATTITSGASGAVFGLCGLLLSTVVYGYVRQPRLPFSRLAATRIGAGAAVFMVATAWSQTLGVAASMAALAAGSVVGLLTTRSIVEERPHFQRVATVVAPLMAIALLSVWPLHGTIDARPAVAQIATVETRTASSYDSAVAAYTHGRMSAKALAQLIERDILPALAADRDRIAALRGVPREQATLVSTARRYFELREASWRRRIDGLRGSNMKALREADRVERSALDAFERLKREADIADHSA